MACEEHTRAGGSSLDEEPLFRDIFKATSDGLFILDERGQILLANERAGSMFGCTDEEFLQLSLRDLSLDQPPYSQAEMIQQIRHALETGPCHFPWRTRRKNGELFWSELALRTCTIAGERRMIASVRDVTEQVEISERLRASERKSRAVFDLSFGFIGLLTADGTVLDANRSALEFAGARLSDVLGQPFWETPWCKHSPATRDRVRAAIRAAAGGEMVHFEATLRFADGSMHTVDFTLRPMMDDAGRVTLLIPEGRDITEHKRAEHALRESEERFRSLSNLAPEGIMIHEHGVIVDFNLAFARLFGYEQSEELIGQDALELLLDEESRERLRQRSDQKETGLIEVTGRRKDGSTFAVETDSRPVKYLGQNASLVSFNDITERKAAEVDHARLEEQLLQAQKMESVGRLAGGVAHDFNNHLTVIISHCRMMLAQLDPQDPMTESIQQVLRAGEQSAQLTQQLLAFSRKQILQPKIFCPNDVVTETVHMLDRIIGEDIELHTRLDPELGAIQADAGQINQVLMNLAVNARDAMPKGGAITIETSNLELHEEFVERHPEVKPGAYVLVTVSDNGTGMDKATLDRIFEPFFTTKVAGMGTGLGLATVYGIVQQSGGSIWAYSEPGRGTTFKLYFPRVDAPVEVECESDIPLDSMGGDETILLVEDHDGLRLLTTSILEGLGYHLLSAANGAEALEKSGDYSETIHLMITDVVMPGMTGGDLARCLAPLRPQMKVLFTSGYTADVIAHQGVLDPGVSYLSKPFTPNVLAQKVRGILTKSRRG
jgi:PAS domain S-box-containing protein